MAAAPFGDVRSPVSIAATDPPSESPTNRTPSGPNASAPADFSWSLPALRLAVILAGASAMAIIASAETAATASAIRRKTGRLIINPLLEFRFWIGAPKPEVYH